MVELRDLEFIGEIEMGKKLILIIQNLLILILYVKWMLLSWVVIMNILDRAENILAPGKGKNMGDGWETRRSRGKNFDWLIIKFGKPGLIKKLEIDTHHFKGNYPDTCSIQTANISKNLSNKLIANNSKNWKFILNKSKLSAHKKHVFKKFLTKRNKENYLKINIHPDGGISRIRAFWKFCKMKVIKAKNITKKNFSKFGQLIDASKKNPISINDGYAKRFDDLINIDVSKDKGRAIISIFNAKKRRFPMKIDMMEKHPLGSQAFIPMEDTKFLVFVAPRGDKPDINKIQSFLVPKQTGVNYKAGIWHFPLISMKNMNYLIVDRKGKGNNLVIYKFKKDKIILKK